MANNIEPIKLYHQYKLGTRVLIDGSICECTVSSGGCHTPDGRCCAFVTHKHPCTNVFCTNRTVRGYKLYCFPEVTK